MSDPKLPQIFKPEGFQNIDIDDSWRSSAEIAQQIFEQWIKSNGVVVYIKRARAGNQEIIGIGEKHLDGDTHTGYLLCVQEIEKKPELKLVRKCPKCQSINVATERRIDGNSTCRSCGYRNSTKYFDSYVMEQK